MPPAMYSGGGGLDVLLRNAAFEWLCLSIGALCDVNGMCDVSRYRGSDVQAARDSVCSCDGVERACPTQTCSLRSADLQPSLVAWCATEESVSAQRVLMRSVFPGLRVPRWSRGAFIGQGMFCFAVGTHCL
jgi:hypothetical protein